MAKVGMRAVPPTFPGVIEGTVVKETVAVVGVDVTVKPGPATTEDKVPVLVQPIVPDVLSRIVRTWPLTPGVNPKLSGTGQI